MKRLIRKWLGLPTIEEQLKAKAQLDAMLEDLYYTQGEVITLKEESLEDSEGTAKEISAIVNKLGDGILTAVDLTRDAQDFANGTVQVRASKKVRRFAVKKNFKNSRYVKRPTKYNRKKMSCSNPGCNCHKTVDSIDALTKAVLELVVKIKNHGRIINENPFLNGEWKYYKNQ